MQREPATMAPSLQVAIGSGITFIVGTALLVYGGQKTDCGWLCGVPEMFLGLIAMGAGALVGIISLIVWGMRRRGEPGEAEGYIRDD